MSYYSGEPRLRQPFVGKYNCSVCGYSHDSEQVILKHRLEMHPNADTIIREKYRRVFDI